MPSKPPASTGNSNSKAKPPSKYMKERMKEVEEDYSDQLKITKASVVNRLNKLEHIDVLRRVLEDLPPDTELTISMSNFWLGLEKQQGIDRRLVDPPKSPFTPGKRPQLATLKAIRDWDIAWINMAARNAALQELSRTCNRHHSVMKKSVENSFDFFCFRGKEVVGQVLEIDPSQFRELLLQQSHHLVVESLTMKKALLRPWLDQKARGRWIQRWEQASKGKIEALRRAVSEQERLFELTRAEINFVGLAHFNRTGPSIRKNEPII